MPPRRVGSAVPLRGDGDLLKLVRQGVCHLLKNVAPRAKRGLLKRSRGWVPHAFLAAGEPAPLADRRQRDPRPQTEAPAKWATAVSGEMIRSSWFMMAAVSMKSRPRRPGSSIKGNSLLAASSCSTPWPTCRLIRRTPGTAANGARLARGNDFHRPA